MNDHSKLFERNKQIKILQVLRALGSPKIDVLDPETELKNCEHELKMIRASKAYMAIEYWLKTRELPEFDRNKALHAQREMMGSLPQKIASLKKILKE